MRFGRTVPGSDSAPHVPAVVPSYVFSVTYLPRPIFFPDLPDALEPRGFPKPLAEQG